MIPTKVTRMPKLMATAPQMSTGIPMPSPARIVSSNKNELSKNKLQQLAGIVVYFMPVVMF